MIPDWLKTWYRSGDTGISSEVIARTFTREFSRNLGIPRDPSDVGRCVRLLDLAEANGAHWREDFAHIMRQHEAWRPLLDRWSEIETAYREQLVAEKIARDAARKRWPATWRKRMAHTPSYCYYLLVTLRGDADPYKNEAVPWARP